MRTLLKIIGIIILSFGVCLAYDIFVGDKLINLIEEATDKDWNKDGFIGDLSNGKEDNNDDEDDKDDSGLDIVGDDEKTYIFENDYFKYQEINNKRYLYAKVTVNDDNTKIIYGFNIDYINFKNKDNQIVLAIYDKTCRFDEPLYEPGDSTWAKIELTNSDFLNVDYFLNNPNYINEINPDVHLTYF